MFIKYALVILLCMLFFICYAQMGKAEIPLSRIRLSPENLLKLEKEWDSDEIRCCNVLFYESRNDTFYAFCPYIVNAKKKVGMYLYRSSFFGIKGGSLPLIAEDEQMQYANMNIQMYISVLQFEDSLVITQNIEEKKSAINRFFALYGKDFSYLAEKKMRKMYLKKMFDPLFPDFPKKSFHKLPISTSSIDTTVKNFRVFSNKKIVKSLHKLWISIEHKDSNKVIINLLEGCSACKEWKCKDCYMYEIKPLVTRYVKKSMIGLFVYTKRYYPCSLSNGTERFLPILVFQNKVTTITINPKQKELSFKRFVQKYGHYFSQKDLETLYQYYLKPYWEKSMKNVYYYDGG